MDERKLAQGMMVRVGLTVFGLATLAILVLTLISDRGILAVHERANRLGELEEQIEALEVENDTIIDEIRTLKEDPTEIERRAREELKLARPGEVILIVPPNPPQE